ncbi:carbohydrate ABC transporter permease [Mycetocola spongiae]|uniref:carbohydrate ABC transporter permease n=1 Tax=Mycetocola spongiae TaxID=2859226 RepID=UPI001CF4CC33|nr:sugar ABC transporter permease [Mycetocola spongiae]UCR88642.1 sugar ABC transporter permease [Mycetocola spongiae]
MTHTTPSVGQRLVGFANRHRALVLAGPAVAFIIAMVAFPLVYTLYLSMTDASGSVRADVNFNGFDNFAELLGDTDRFWPAVWRTVFFTGGAVIVELSLGMAIALLLRRSFRGERWVRVAVLLPLVATPVAVGMMWLLIFEPTIGAANELLRFLGIPPQGWISSRTQALPTLMFVDIWQWTPMVVIILLAGLTSLPEEPDEAARVDGASSLQRFWYVTLPLLAPTMVTAVLLRSIDALKTFDILYATKGKGGGSFHEAETLNVLAYSYSFDYNDYGLSSAVLVLFFLMIVGLCGLLIWTRRKRAL